MLQFVSTPFPAHQVATPLRTLAGDPHPRVRLHAIVASTYLDTPEAVEIAMVAADHPTDKFIDFALEQAVHSLKPRWLPALREGTLLFDHEAGRLARFVRADGTADTLDALRALLRSPTLDPAGRESFLAILAETGNADDLAAVLDIGDESLKARLLPGVTRAAQLRGIRPPGDLAATVRSLLASPTPAIQDEALRLIGAWKIESLKPVLLEHAATAPGALAGLLALDLDAAARLAAGELASDSAADRAAILLPPFFHRDSAAGKLASALQSTPPSAPAASAALRVLNERGLSHPALDAVLRRAAGPAATGWTWSDNFAHALAAEARSAGDIGRGRAIYHRAELTCIACHAVGGEGGLIGPALDAVGAAQPLDFLVGAVLAPQKEVKEGFDAVQATLKSGDVVLGYRAPGAPGDLTLRDPAAGTLHRLPRSSVTQETSLGSLMPASLVDSLSREELRDLISYLGSLGKSDAGSPRSQLHPAPPEPR